MTEMTSLSGASLFKYLYLSRFSQPKADRTLYRAIRRQRTATILEIGIGSCQRSPRLIETALRYREAREIRYTGIDLFEARPKAEPGVKLKQAHRTLKPLGVKFQLVPGDPFFALARVANSLPNTDLIVISGDQECDSLERAWFYLPRMLHEESEVYLEQLGPENQDSQFQRVSRLEIERLSVAHRPQARRAA